MASIQEKVAESLKVLKKYQSEHPKNFVIRGQKILGKVHTQRLKEHGYLQIVMKGWYIPSFPGREGDTVVWYSSYWNFVSSYANFYFGDAWCLSAEQSLSYYSGETVAPKQLIVRSPKAQNNVIKLMFGDTMLTLKSDIPKNVFIEEKNSLHLYSLAEALIFCSPQYFKSNALSARALLYSLKSVDEILKILVDNGNSTRASRLIGALRNVGRDDMANEIKEVMKRVGHDVKEENPFDDSSANLQILPLSPHQARISLKWQQMREQIINLNIKKLKINLEGNDILKNMEDNYVKDSYHSLLIEGYRVTERLIKRVIQGDWNPLENNEDAQAKNALAARGYYQAFQEVKKSVEKILNGESPGEVVANDFSTWHFQLFQPSISANIIKASDLIGYRSHQVYIRGSRHTPFNPDVLLDAMTEFLKCLKKEEDSFVRAILGHHVFVYIHPYMDGNGRIARFLMNTMLVTGGYPWTIIPIERRQEYMDALEKASTMEDITGFAKFILSLLER